jgi:hypothetical protein
MSYLVKQDNAYAYASLDNELATYCVMVVRRMEAMRKREMKIT